MSKVFRIEITRCWDCPLCVDEEADTDKNFCSYDKNNVFEVEGDTIPEDCPLDDGMKMANIPKLLKIGKCSKCGATKASIVETKEGDICVFCLQDTGLDDKDIRILFYEKIISDYEDAK